MRTSSKYPFRPLVFVVICAPIPIGKLVVKEYVSFAVPVLEATTVPSINNLLVVPDLETAM